MDHIRLLLSLALISYSWGCADEHDFDESAAQESSDVLCLPSYEPNDNYEGTHSLGNVNDFISKSFTSNLSPGDSDWYAYTVDDDIKGFLEGAVSFQFFRNAIRSGGAQARVCAYWFNEDNSNPEADCEDGTQTEVEGISGCCSTTVPGSGGAYLNLDIGTSLISDDDGILLISVERLDSNDSCAGYSLSSTF